MSVDQLLDQRPTIFLSHRYHSPEVNRYFWRVISDVQRAAFRVDEGTMFTSPTRLERMIRDADGFVGIYPLPGDPQRSWDVAAARHEARYFLMELSAAVRLRKPAIVFSDHRYGPLLRPPPDVMLIEYDPQEIADTRDTPLTAHVAGAYRSFVERLRSTMAIQRGARSYEKRMVGLLLPPDLRTEVAEPLERALGEAAWEPVHLTWPPRLDLQTTARLRKLDWAILALDTPAAQMAAGFVLGHGVPLMPLRRTTGAPEQQQAEDVEEVLFGTGEVGHRKALLRWTSTEDLEPAFRTHLKAIGQQPRYVHDENQAFEYFESATRRRERVFLSYAREDGAVAEQFSKLLHASFQEVFDYRTTASIKFGEPWLPTLLDGLALSAVGVLLLSPSYLESPYCRLESEQLLRANIEGRVRLLPICLERLTLPEPLSSLQYRALYKSKPEDIVAELVRDLKASDQAPK